MDAHKVEGGLRNRQRDRGLLRLLPRRQAGLRLVRLRQLVPPVVGGHKADAQLAQPLLRQCGHVR